jgi:hypothetical protein
MCYTATLAASSKGRLIRCSVRAGAATARCADDPNHPRRSWRCCRLTARLRETVHGTFCFAPPFLGHNRNARRLPLKAMGGGNEQFDLLNRISRCGAAYFVVLRPALIDQRAFVRQRFRRATGAEQDPAKQIELWPSAVAPNDGTERPRPSPTMPGVWAADEHRQDRACVHG